MEMKLMRHQDHDDDDEFLQNLPLKTMDEFNFFDEELNNKSIRKILHNHLTGIGGRDGRNIVRSIAKRLFSKELAKNFSWFGQKGNRNLSLTNIGKAIMRAAKREKPVICERDVIHVMIDFLRHCKDKPRNRQQQQ
uniref:DUF4806 domain-containing protein n=1 Tax=Daphnia galeata TaxID=27404 RepID=A0A8J2S4Y7_9CRUS|nr:unnamed protein product [Daphnia galeata]